MSEIYSNALSAPAPCNIDWFQKSLDVATKDRAISLRIIWGPDATKISFHGQRVKKYAIPGASYKHVIGYKVISGGQQVGYRSLAGIVTGSQDGIMVPDVREEQACLERWIIEQKQPDQIARMEWEATRYFDVGGTKIDKGEFPEEGIWLWFDQIEDHESANHRTEGSCKVCTCCRAFAEHNAECIGRYRPPDYRDLEYVQRCLKWRDSWPKLRDINEQPTASELSAWTQRCTDMLDSAQEKNDQRLEEELTEAATTLLNIRLQPRFDMGAAFRKKDLCKNKTS